MCTPLTRKGGANGKTRRAGAMDVHTADTQKGDVRGSRWVPCCCLERVPLSAQHALLDEESMLSDRPLGHRPRLFSTHVHDRNPKSSPGLRGRASHQWRGRTLRKYSAMTVCLHRRGRRSGNAITDSAGWPVLVPSSRSAGDITDATRFASAGFRLSTASIVAECKFRHHVAQQPWRLSIEVKFPIKSGTAASTSKRCNQQQRCDGSSNLAIRNHQS